MSRLLLRLARGATALLQRVVPSRADQVAWVSQPDYADSSFHLYRRLATERRDELRHVWLVSDPSVAARIRSDHRRFTEASSDVRVVGRQSLRGYWALLRSRWVFHTNGVQRTVRSAHGRHVVSLWHGMPIKRVGVLDNTSVDIEPVFGSLHLATSELFRYVVALSFGVDVERVHLSALPRTDVLTRPHAMAPTRAEIEAALGIPPAQRLVVWLPTFRTSSLSAALEPGRLGPRCFLDDLSPEALARIDEEAGRWGCTVLVKLHPYDPLNDRDPGAAFDHVRFVRSSDWLATGIDLYDLLAVSDALLSDVSSVVVDFLVTERPIGLIGFDAGSYTRDLVIPYATLQASRRLDDLSEPPALGPFFEAVAAGPARPPAQDDVGPWLHAAPAGTGCATVLAAVGLG